MRILFRADATLSSGAGHVVRCLSLADSLRDAGSVCQFATCSATAEVVPALKRSRHATATLSGNICSEFDELRQFYPEGVDWMIIDHYERGLDFERECRGWARQIMVIDDLPERRHHCDVLLDQTLGRQPFEYSHLVPNHCRILTGSNYSLLRRGFGAWRNRTLERRNNRSRIKRIMVSMGATDSRNLTAVALDGIEAAGLDVEVDVLLGAGSQHINEIRKKTEVLSYPVSVHIDPPRIAKLMADADLAIGAAGTSTWERCCLGLPALVVTLASNQRDIAKAITATGAAREIAANDRLNPMEIAEVLKELDSTKGALFKMSRDAAKICDGLGAVRTTLALQPSREGTDGGKISLRFAQAEDEATMLRWQQAPSMRRFARQSRVPDADEHHEWFVRRLRSETCFLMIIEHRQESAGVLRLDRVDRGMSSPAYEVSILVAPEKRRRGIARAALSIAREWLPGIEFVAEVLPENQASLGLFETAAYQHVESGIFQSLPKPSVT